MPTHCRTDSLDFGSVEGRSIVAAFDGGEITSDGGALLLARTNGAIRLIDRVAAAFTDRRNPDLIEHEVVTMAGQRIIGEALVQLAGLIPSQRWARMAMEQLDDLA